MLYSISHDFIRLKKSNPQKISNLRKKIKKVSLNTQQWTKHLSKFDNKMFYTHFRRHTIKLTKKCSLEIFLLTCLPSLFEPMPENLKF